MKTQTRGPQNDLLQAFVGHWKMEGFNGPTAPEASGERIGGYEVFEWLEGQHYMIQRFNRQMGAEKFVALGWIGYDAQNKTYLSYMITNQGNMRIYSIDIEENRIRFYGDYERGSLELEDNGSTLSEKWEHRIGNQNWQMLCELKGQKVV